MCLDLRGVAVPQWHQGLSWLDHGRQLMWRADQTAFITDRPIKPGGILTTHPELSESWWAAFCASLDVLGRHTTTRVAVSQTGVTKTIRKVFSDVDTTVEEWTAAHADLAWANLTAPNCYGSRHLLDGRRPATQETLQGWPRSLYETDFLAGRPHGYQGVAVFHDGRELSYTHHFGWRAEHAVRCHMPHGGLLLPVAV